MSDAKGYKLIQQACCMQEVGMDQEEMKEFSSAEYLHIFRMMVQHGRAETQETMRRLGTSILMDEAYEIPASLINELKKKGVRVNDLARFDSNAELAMKLWRKNLNVPVEDDASYCVNPFSQMTCVIS